MCGDEDLIGGRVEMQLKPISTAPRDGTILLLLVSFVDNSLEDSDAFQVTIGANTYDHSEIDQWEIAGWHWGYDEFTKGHGSVLGWYAPLESIKGVDPDAAIN